MIDLVELIEEERYVSKIVQKVYRTASRLLERNFSGVWYGRIKEAPDILDRCIKATNVAFIRVPLDCSEARYYLGLMARSKWVKALLEKDLADEVVLKELIIRRLIRKFRNGHYYRKVEIFLQGGKKTDGDYVARQKRSNFSECYF